MAEIKTTFAGANPFHAKATGIEDMQYVERPEHCPLTRGATLYDEQFDELFKSPKAALEIPADKFHSVRSAMERYLINKKMDKTHRMRQHKVGDRYTVWFVEGASKKYKKAYRK